jgi:hypothetical protein
VTTKHEGELQDIERRLSLLRAGKKSQVHPSEIAHLEIQRERGRERDERTKALGGEIRCRWVTGEPKKWESATVEVEIGEKSYLLEIEPYEESDGKQKLRAKLVKLGYQGFAESWALWKWHTQRGSELDEATDTYILDCKAPAFVWELPRAKPGPKPKVQVAA